MLAQDIAVAAIKFQILKQAAGNDIVFNEERALSLEGDSGPYMQYAFARSRSLIEKAAALPASQTHRQIQTLDDLLFAFTEGFEPDLKDPDQLRAFELYKRMRFGDPNTQLPHDAMSELKEILAKNPKLTKEPFRSIHVSQQSKSYPVTPELKKFTESVGKTTAQIKSNLFQIDANGGYWQTLLQYEAPDHGGILIGKKLKRGIAKVSWTEFLNQHIKPEMRAQIADPNLSGPERAKLLYGLLTQEKAAMLKRGQDIRPLSQAIVDLVHTVGFHDPEVLEGLKSKDGLARIEALLEERERS
jgi:hypothetical protein